MKKNELTMIFNERKLVGRRKISKVCGVCTIECGCNIIIMPHPRIASMLKVIFKFHVIVVD